MTEKYKGWNAWRVPALPEEPLPVADRCPILGKHQYFNIMDPDACCYGCGKKLD